MKNLKKINAKNSEENFEVLLENVEKNLGKRRKS